MRAVHYRTQDGDDLQIAADSVVLAVGAGRTLPGR